ncbi:hypothetical protein KR52_05240 [Synechococcus sp. KORDI-52]|nr:hypothetical protein KR52_05240 [Synechococcus sp. KORDI-52]
MIAIGESNHDQSKTILSSESLFWLVPELIQNKSNWEKYIDLHIILAVREIEEMLSSEYQQRVKRHGDSMPLEQFIRARHFISSHHEKAAEIISLMSQANISNTIINYSQHKRDISKLIFKLIGAEKLYPEDQVSEAIINRSLSGKELEILIIINALYYNKYPWISTRISDALIKSQPKIEAKQCKINKQQLEKIYEKNDSFLKIINASLDPNEQLTSIATLKEPKSQLINPEQAHRIRQEEAISLQLIGDELLQAFTHESKRKLSNETVDAIIALSQSGKVSKVTEVELLDVAKENRPQGQKLAKLLERAKAQLASGKP